jgi:alkanesulfonate monooxygenase SsuD/methylene tetrahydromethanopterin reductase-like flavin-dependent oxidoreductase (luciferase family)
LRWGIGHARRARADTDLDPDELSFGVHVTIALDDDADQARDQGAGILTAVSRLSVRYGEPDASVDGPTRSALKRVRAHYSMNDHAESASAQAKVVPDEFADRFGICDPPELCTARPREIAAVGVDRVVLIPQLKPSDPDGVTLRRIGDEVIPAFAQAPVR